MTSEPPRFSEASRTAPASLPPETSGVPVARFVLRREHHVRALLRASDGAQRRVRLRYLAYAAVMTFLWAVLHELRPTGFMLLYGAVVFAGAAALRPFFLRRQAERLVGDRPDIGADVTVRVEDGAFVVEAATVYRTSQRLGTLHAVVPEPDGILIEPFANEALFVPAEAFATPAERAAFERALLAGARLPDPAL